MFKLLNKEDVKSVVEKLIALNGETSAKNVKDELRNKGFWAIQWSVSNFMKQHFEEWDLDCKSNGEYNIYTKKIHDKQTWDVSDNIMTSTNLINVSVDLDEPENDDDSNCGKKCRITTIKRISDDEVHIDVFSPTLNANVNVILNRELFDGAQYQATYEDNIVCYVGSNGTKLTNKQARYYSWKVFEKEYINMIYFDVKCYRIK